MMEVKVTAVEGKKLITDRLFQGDRTVPRNTGLNNLKFGQNCRLYDPFI